MGSFQQGADGAFKAQECFQMPHMPLEGKGQVLPGAVGNMAALGPWKPLSFLRRHRAPLCSPLPRITPRQPCQQGKSGRTDVSGGKLSGSTEKKVNQMNDPICPGARVQGHRPGCAAAWTWPEWITFLFTAGPCCAFAKQET